jgi:hypothetical protein
MNIPDHISESLETVFGLKILKFFDADPGSGIFLTLDPGSGFRDPGWKNSDPGQTSRILKTGFEEGLFAFRRTAYDSSSGPRATRTNPSTLTTPEVGTAFILLDQIVHDHCIYYPVPFFLDHGLKTRYYSECINNTVFNRVP